jgi:hypothetical protein
MKKPVQRPGFGSTAPCERRRPLDSSMTGKKFLAYVETSCPRHSREDIVMIDNLPAHKAAGAQGCDFARSLRALRGP